MSEDKKLRRNEFNEQGVAFGVGLFDSINRIEKKRTIIVSPMSVQLAVGFSYLAAGPKTSNEMVECLQFFHDREANIDMLARILCRYHKNEKIRLACKFFVQKGLKFKPGALESFDKLRNIAIHRIDFFNARKAAKTINYWVKIKTKSKIENVIQPEELADTQLAIVSAIYFSMPWELQFEVVNEKFWINGTDVATVPMIKCAIPGILLADIPELDCKAIQIPFEDKDHIMLVVLPNSKTGIDSLVAALPTFKFSDFLGRAQHNFLMVYLPKFRLEFIGDLTEPFIQMGMKTALTKPDFSEFFENSEGLVVKNVVHKTFIEITEKGRPRTSSPDGPDCVGPIKLFAIEHPFLFAIVSKHNRIVLMGTVRNPL